jgi:hypothetical protein
MEENESQLIINQEDGTKKPGPFDNLPLEIEKLFKDILLYRVDPNNEYYKITIESITEQITQLNTHAAVAADSEKIRNLLYDPYLESFIMGCGGQITTFSKVETSMTPAVFRGITKHSLMKKCTEMNRDYYYIDSGYFGNVKKKQFHRITKNGMQNTGPIIDRPATRLQATGWEKKKFRSGTNILLCPPSEKAMSAFGLNLNDWMATTISTIKQHTDRPIIIREKKSRRDRLSSDTMEAALSRDVHCLVTYNSIAATEALLLGKPAFTLGPNAAQSLCLNDLSKIENPNIPSLDEVVAWASHLAYCQFTQGEMASGYAWAVLNGNA